MRDLWRRPSFSVTAYLSPLGQNFHFGRALDLVFWEIPPELDIVSEKAPASQRPALSHLCSPLLDPTFFSTIIGRPTKPSSASKANPSASFAPAGIPISSIKVKRVCGSCWRRTLAMLGLYEPPLPMYTSSTSPGGPHRL